MMHLRYLLVISLFISQTYCQDTCTTPTGRPGECRLISQCSSLRNLLIQIRNNVAPPNAISHIRSSVCRILNGRTILLCCATNSQRLGGGSGVASPPSSVPAQPTVNLRDRGLSLLPDRRSCGRLGFISDFIVNGEDIDVGEWPWIALLSGRSRNGRVSFFCGGTLISSRYVVSAAHCFKSTNGITLESVRLGEQNIRTNPDCGTGFCASHHQDIRAERVIQHPQYNRNCRECNDIALIRLSSPAQFNHLSVVPICLPIDPQRDMGFSVHQYNGKVAKTVGLGSVIGNPGSNFQPSIIQQVRLPLRESDFCRRLKRNYRDPSTVLCAGNGDGKDSCRGDSGGPLTLTSNSGIQSFLVGVTSLGPSHCGALNTQGLYTNVHSYINWILETIEP